MARNWFKRKKKQPKPDPTIEDSVTTDDGHQLDPSPEPSIQESSPDLPETTAQQSEATPVSQLDSPGEDHSSGSESPVPDEAQSPEQTGSTTASPSKKGFFNRLRRGLSKTRQVLTTDIDELFGSTQKIDDEFWEELEELLITSDLGVRTAMDLIENVRQKASKIGGPEELKTALKTEIVELVQGRLDTESGGPPAISAKPHVIMVVGVNGVGKTTTIGKLAARHTAAGRKVLIAAADTFRAAAIEQLMTWADRAGAEIVKHKENADPAAVVFDSIEAAQARDIDLVLVDTAGRLHTKVNLMEELKKIQRTIAKKIPTAPHEVLLVLDATTGQNAIAQADQFHEALELTGLALTKLDGTAKGGIVISICSAHNIPLHYIGIGEQIDDLQNFDAVRFVEALF